MTRLIIRNLFRNSLSWLFGWQIRIHLNLFSDRRCNLRGFLSLLIRHFKSSLHIMIYFLPILIFRRTSRMRYYKFFILKLIIRRFYWIRWEFLHFNFFLFSNVEVETSCICTLCCLRSYFLFANWTWSSTSSTCVSLTIMSNNLSFTANLYITCFTLL